MSSIEKLDIIVWAHSDQVGGTEMACVLCSALRQEAGAGLKCGIITPMPLAVRDYFKMEPARSRGIVTILSQPLLRLEKDSKKGEVSTDKTCEWVQELVKKGNDVILNEAIKLIEPWKHDKTLVISCGEPVALAAAKQLNLNRIIVTDHFITQSVNKVLKRRGAIPDAVWDFISTMENYEHAAEAAWLSPPEFGMPEYWNYLANICHIQTVAELNGPFYDSIPHAELINAPHYDKLNEVRSEWPLVIVFGGGGAVWDEIYIQLHESYAKLGKSVESEQRDVPPFALILRHVQDGKVIPRTWQLHLPDGSSIPLADPGKMMYWYSLCTLLVGRGGLAAQQIIATPTSKVDPGAPVMLFVEEPGHEQIESERDRLSRNGLVESSDMATFKNDPFKMIAETVAQKDKRKNMREAIELRYGAKPVGSRVLADHLLRRYEPHHHPNISQDVLSLERPLSHFPQFIDRHQDEIKVFGVPSERRSGRWPDHLEIHPPPPEGKKNCWAECPHCYGADMSLLQERLTLEAAIKVIRDLKGKVPRLVFSGLNTDPLFSPMLPDLLKAARESTAQNIGIYTKLFKLDRRILEAMFEGCQDGDYITVSLDAGTPSTHAKTTGFLNTRQAQNRFNAVTKNLFAIRDQKRNGYGRFLRLNVSYVLTENNLSPADIRGAYEIANACGATMIRYSVMQAPVMRLPVIKLQRQAVNDNTQLEDAFEAIRRLPSRGTRVRLVNYSHWSNEGFNYCYAQDYYPALGADGYLYPCCQVAWKSFEHLRIGKPDNSGDFEKFWKGKESQQRRSLLTKEVGKRGGTSKDAMNCRVCNRRDGAINTGVAAWVMSDI